MSASQSVQAISAASGAGAEDAEADDSAAPSSEEVQPETATSRPEAAATRPRDRRMGHEGMRRTRPVPAGVPPPGGTRPVVATAGRPAQPLGGLPASVRSSRAGPLPGVPEPARGPSGGSPSVREALRQVVAHRHLQLVVGAAGRLPVGAPAQELAGV